MALGVSCHSAGGTADANSATARPPRPPLAIAVIGNPGTFNPIVADDPAARTVGGAIFDTLLRLDPDTAEARPNLATNWSLDPSGTIYTFELRDDVRWQDGEPFGADDVVFTLAAIRAIPDNAYASFLNVDGAPIGVEKVAEHSVRFTLPRPYAPFLHSLIIPIVPRHLLGDDGTAIAERWGTDTAVGDIVGTGPFRIAEYAANERILLERNPTYWRSREDGTRLPLLDHYVIRIAADRKTARDWFLAGAIHIFNPRFDEASDLIAAAKRDFAVRAVGPDTASLFVTFNRNPFHYRRDDKIDPRLTWFQDTRFLVAVAHSIDKRAMIDKALDGHGVPEVSYLSPANQFYDTELTDYTYDPQLARSILESAHYIDRDGDGIREDANENPITFSLCTNEGNPLRERMAKLLIGNLADVGIRVTLERLSFPALFERLDATYAWDAMLIGFTGGIDPASSENLLRSTGDLHVWHPAQQMPASAWEAQIDDLLDSGSRELDPTKRRDIYWHVQEILHRELPMIPLVRPTLFVAYRRDVENFSPSPWGFHRIEELDIRESDAAAVARGSQARDER